MQLLDAPQARGAPVRDLVGAPVFGGQLAAQLCRAQRQRALVGLRATLVDQPLAAALLLGGRSEGTLGVAQPALARIARLLGGVHPLERVLDDAPRDLLGARDDLIERAGPGALIGLVQRLPQAVLDPAPHLLPGRGPHAALARLGDHLLGSVTLFAGAVECPPQLLGAPRVTLA